jgi:pentatricopeptide repeat protein
MFIVNQIRSDQKRCRSYPLIHREEEEEEEEEEEDKKKEQELCLELLCSQMAMASQIALLPPSPSPLIPSRASSPSLRLLPRLLHRILPTNGFGKPLRALTNDTIAALAPSPKQLSPHLSRLSQSLISSDGGELLLGASLQPFIQQLSLDDWVALVLDLGEKDFSISLKVLHSLKVLIGEDGSKNANQRMEASAGRLDSKQDSLVKESQDSKTDDASEGSRASVKGSMEVASIDDNDSRSDPDSKDSLGLVSLSSSSSSCSSIISKMYTSLVKELARNKRFEDVEKLQAHMEKESLAPDRDFYDALLKSYAYEGLLVKASEVLEAMKEAGFQPTQFTYEKVNS